MNRIRPRLVTGVFLAAAWTLAIPSATAQSGDSESGEIAAFAGVGFTGASHAAFGGSAGMYFSRHGMALLEASFMPMGTTTIQPWPAPATVRSSHLYDFAVDFHIRVPVRERWEPYAIVGAAVLWNTVSQNSADSNGVAVVHHYDQFNGALHTGGGLRYFVAKNWGIRPEVKVIVSKSIYTRISMGIFYVTPPDWP